MRGIGQFGQSACGKQDRPKMYVVVCNFQARIPHEDVEHQLGGIVSSTYVEDGARRCAAFDALGAAC